MMFHWQTSTYSQAGGEPQCIEVGVAADHIGVRDSKAPERGHLDVSRAAFRGLVTLATTSELTTEDGA